MPAERDRALHVPLHGQVQAVIRDACREQRPRALETTSLFFQSKYAKDFYWACVPGWALGIWLLRGRAWTLTLAAAVSAVSLSAYMAAYLYLDGGRSSDICWKARKDPLRLS